MEAPPSGPGPPVGSDESAEVPEATESAVPAAAAEPAAISQAPPSGLGQLVPAGPAARSQATDALGTATVDEVLAAALADGSEIVFGVPANDGGFAKIVRRVVVLAAMAATYYICHSISDLVRGQYSSENSGNVTSLWSAISTLTIELSIPACGYYGALHSNRQLTCCFCSCNLFVAMVTLMQFVRIELRIGEIDGQCERERNGQERRTCEVWTSDGPQKYLTLFNLLIVICLGILAFWFGNSLYQKQAQDFHGGGGSAPAPLVGEVISLSSAGASAGASASGGEGGAEGAAQPLQTVDSFLQTPAVDGAALPLQPPALERAPSLASASGVEVVVDPQGSAVGPAEVREETLDPSPDVEHL